MEDKGINDRINQLCDSITQQLDRVEEYIKSSIKQSVQEYIDKYVQITHSRVDTVHVDDAYRQYEMYCEYHGGYLPCTRERFMYEVVFNTSVFVNEFILDDKLYQAFIGMIIHPVDHPSI